MLGNLPVGPLETPGGKGGEGIKGWRGKQRMEGEAIFVWIDTKYRYEFNRIYEIYSTYG